jgi:hypothetical protein
MQVALQQWPLQQWPPQCAALTSDSNVAILMLRDGLSTVILLKSLRPGPITDSITAARAHTRVACLFGKF